MRLLLVRREEVKSCNKVSWLTPAILANAEIENRCTNFGQCVLQGMKFEGGMGCGCGDM